MNWFSFESMFSKIHLSTHLFILKTRNIWEECKRYLFLYQKKKKHLWDHLSVACQSSGHLLSSTLLPKELLKWLCLHVEEQNWGIWSSWITHIFCRGFFQLNNFLNQEVCAGMYLQSSPVRRDGIGMEMNGSPPCYECKSMALIWLQAVGKGDSY